MKYQKVKMTTLKQLLNSQCLKFSSYSHGFMVLKIYQLQKHHMAKIIGTWTRRCLLGGSSVPLSGAGLHLCVLKLNGLCQVQVMLPRVNIGEGQPVTHNIQFNREKIQLHTAKFTCLEIYTGKIKVILHIQNTNYFSRVARVCWLSKAVLKYG